MHYFSIWRRCFIFSNKNKFCCVVKYLQGKQRRTSHEDQVRASGLPKPSMGCHFWFSEGRIGRKLMIHKIQEIHIQNSVYAVKTKNSRNSLITKNQDFLNGLSYNFNNGWTQDVKTLEHSYGYDGTNSELSMSVVATAPNKVLMVPRINTLLPLEAVQICSDVLMQ